MLAKKKRTRAGADIPASPLAVVVVGGTFVAVVGDVAGLGVVVVVVVDPMISSHFRWSRLDGETS